MPVNLSAAHTSIMATVLEGSSDQKRSGRTVGAVDLFAADQIAITEWIWLSEVCWGWEELQLASAGPLGPNCSISVIFPERQRESSRHQRGTTNSKTLKKEEATCLHSIPKSLCHSADVGELIVHTSRESASYGHGGGNKKAGSLCLLSI